MQGAGPLSFQALIDDSQFMARIGKIENRIIGLSDLAVREGKRLDSVFTNLGKLAVGGLALSGLSELPQQILKVRSEYQALEISLNTMLKSKAKADQLLKDVTQFAGQTPFSLKSAADGAKQLLAYGIAAKDVVPTLRTLGNVSAGLNLPLERLTYLYGTTKTQGRLFAQDLNQFVGSGIPLIQQLALQFQVSEDRVKDLVEQGRVGFPQVKRALEELTTGSGIFAGTLEAQSKSLNALRERLGDAWERMLNDIGKKNEGLAADVFTVAAETVEQYQKVIDTLKVLVGAYSGYKAATLLVAVAQKGNIAITAAQAIAQAQAANATGFLTLSQERAAASTALLTRAQVALNSVMRINPIILIGTALAALVTSYLVFKEEVQDVKSAQELLAGAAQDTNSKMATQKAEVVGLIAELKNQNLAESVRLEAYQKLNAINPKILNGLDFQKAKTADLTKTLNEYLDSLRQKIKLEAGQGAFKEAFQQELEAGEKVNKIQKELNDLLAQTDKLNKKTRSGGPEATGAAGSIAAASQITLKKEELAQALKDQQEAEKATAAVEKALGEGLAKGSKEALQAAIAEDELRLQQLNKRDKAYKITEDNLTRHKAALDKLNKNPNQQGPSFMEQLAKAEDVASLRLAKTYAKTEDELEALQKKVQEKIGSSTMGSQQKAQLEKLDSEINYALGKRTKAQKEAEKVGPYGSISYWENVVKLAEEALQKTAKTDTAGIDRQKAIIVNAQAQLEEVRKATAIRSFEEEIDEKMRLYSLYTKWVENYGQVSADQQFSDLKKNGDSYLDYLNAQIAKLETKQKVSPLSQSEATNLGSLLTRKDEFLNKKSAIDVFTQSLQKAEVESRSLGDYLSKLKAKQAELNNVVSPLSADYTQKKEAVAQEIAKTEQQLKDQVTQFLINSASSGQQELAIRRKYNDLRLGLDKQYNGKRTTEYDTALKDINSKEQQEFEEFKQRKFEESEAYRATTKVIIEEGRKQLKAEIEKQKALVADALANNGENSQQFISAKRKLNDLEKSLSSDSTAIIGQFAGQVSQLGQALEQMGGDAAVAGSILISLSSNVTLISQAFQKGTTDAQKYGIAAQGLINLFTTIASAAQQRKQKEAEYYRAVIGQQEQYNLLLNEQLGIQAKSRENVFVKDFVGELEDGFAKYNDAQAKYQQSLRKLQEGRAKIGLQTVDDKAKGLEIIGGAAATGAAIGAIVGPAGAAVGAVIGGIVGGLTTLFGGSKKKADEFGSLLATYPDLIQKSKDGFDEINVALAQSLIQQGLVDDTTKDLLQSTLDWQKQLDEAKEQIKAIVGELAGNLGNNLRDSLVNAFEEGTDAAKAFSASVSSILEDMVTKILFSQAFGSLFDQLQTDLSASLNVAGGGDGNVIDDFQRFTDNSKDALDQYNQWLKHFQDAAKASGFNVLQGSGGTSQATTLSGGIKSLTEETGSVLAGTLNAMRIGQADTNSIIRQQLLALNNIDRNTAGIARTNELLDSMDRRLKNIESDPLRAKGGG